MSEAKHTPEPSEREILDGVKRLSETIALMVRFPIAGSMSRVRRNIAAELRMLADDIDRPRVNALAGMNPEAVGWLVEAVRALLEDQFMSKADLRASLAALEGK
jgi:hypothetical protein